MPSDRGHLTKLKCLHRQKNNESFRTQAERVPPIVFQEKCFPGHGRVGILEAAGTPPRNFLCIRLIQSVLDRLQQTPSRRRWRWNSSYSAEACSAVSLYVRV